MCFFLISLLTATIYNPLRQKRRRLGLLSKITTRRSFFFEKKKLKIYFFIKHLFVKLKLDTTTVSRVASYDFILLRLVKFFC